MSDNEKIEPSTEEPEVVAHLASEGDEPGLEDSAGWCVIN